MIYTYSVYGLFTALVVIATIRFIYRTNLRKIERDLFYRQALESLGIESHSRRFKELLNGNPHYAKILFYFDNNTPTSFQQWLNAKHRKTIELKGAYKCAVILLRVIKKMDLSDPEFRSVFPHHQKIVDVDEKGFLSLFSHMVNYLVEANIDIPFFINAPFGNTQMKKDQWMLDWAKPQFMRDREAGARTKEMST